MQTAIFTNKMPPYLYMERPDGTADVFIYRETLNEVEEGYEYETNEFNTSILSEHDIAEDPYSFMDYSEKEPDVETIAEMAYVNSEIALALLEMEI